MPLTRKISPLTKLRKELTSARVSFNSFFQKANTLASKNNPEALKKLLKKERQEVIDHVKQLQALAHEADRHTEQQIKAKTLLLQKKIEKLKSAQDATQANNYLLEYKRKDLLLQSEELATTNESIHDQNKKLLEQKEQISRQVEELGKTREEIEERKNELEEKMSALLDQADYLHEANQVISNMHGELAKQKDEILSKNEELLNLNLEKNNLIGIVAHDLKSPLNQIKGLVSIIKMTTPNMDAEAVNCLSLIESSAARLGGMISKILDIEAIEAKTLNLNIQQTNLSENLHTIVERFKMDAANKQITLHFETATDAMVNVDSSYSTQIFENLISNAIKFSPSGKNIFVSVENQNGMIISSVKDEGPGMNNDDKKKLFNKYQKLSAKPTGDESSTGLGLSIVKKYVEAMNGKIWCESEYGNGATFFVQFPVA